MNKRKNPYILLTLLFIIVLIFFGLSFKYPNILSPSIKAPEVEPAKETIIKPTASPKPTDAVITISAVGDAMAHESQLIHDYNDDPDIYDFYPVFEKIAPTLQKADFAIVNLETTISGDEFPYTGYPDFNTPISFVDALKKSGIALASLANNHTLDMGAVGAKNTFENLKSMGMDYTGLSLNKDQYYDYYIKDIKGIKTAVIAYSWRTSIVNNYNEKDYILRFWDDIEGIEADIKNVKDLGADVVVMSVHWGTEYRRSYTKEQRKLAETYIALGADVILGSHPHVVEPIERISVKLENGETREGVVAYSMGNFISNMKARYNNTGIVVNIAIRKTPEGEIILEPVTYVPTLINSNRIYNIEASDHVILPAGKYINDKNLFESLTEDEQEKITFAYNDLAELIDIEYAAPLNE